MIISHKRKFVFVHIAKTAGSSISSAICCNYGDFLPSLKAVGYHRRNNPHLPRPKFATTEIHQHAKMYAHIIPFFIKNCWSIDEYFKFACVRNPYDRIVSHYSYLRARANDVINNGDTLTDDQRLFLSFSFKKYLKSKFRVDKQWSYIYSRTGELLVDYIMRMESLQSDFNNVCDRLDRPHVTLENVNKSKHKHYTEYYDDEAREIVERNYAKDIEYFKYKFGE